MSLTISRIALLAVCGAASVFACSSLKDSPPGSSAGSTTATDSSSSAGGSGPCTGGAPDGVCDKYEVAQKACACEDCAGTALCNPGQCKADGVCTLDDDCTCKDCNGDSSCICNHDGVCDPFSESCGCFDCVGSDACKGQALAALCPNATSCSDDDGCTCPICHSGGAGQGGGSDVAFCGDPANCTNDGKCGFDEGCQCADCMTTKECTGGTGGAGGMGGAGGG